MSTSTITKNQKSISSTKRVQKEDKDDTRKIIMEKDQMIKEMKQEILKLKVKSQDIENGNLSMIAMGKHRESIKMADAFIKAGMKDSMFNYDLVVEMENELKEDSQRVSKKEKKKLFKSSVESEFSKNECKCSYCILNKSLGNTSSSSSKCSKLTQVTSSFFMNLEFDPEKYELKSSKKGDKNKELKFFNKRSRKNDLKIELIHRSQDVAPIYDFSLHADTGIVTDCQGVEVMVSMSAFLVVKAMREVQNDSYSDMLEMDTILNNPEIEHTCFNKFFDELEDKALFLDRARKISDMNEQQEMWFLTRYGNRKCYIRINDKDKRAKENHIQWEEFENSMEIECYKLSTPLLRNISFFTDQDKLREDLKNWDLMPHHRSDSSSASDDNFGEIKWKECSSNMTRIMYANQSDRRDDFYLNNFYKKHEESQLTGSEMDLLMHSDLHWNFLDRWNHPPVLLLKLFYMSRRAFFTILYFSGSVKIFTDMVYDAQFNTWEECLDLCKELIRYHYYYRNNEEKMSEIQVYRKFEERLFQNELIYNDFTKRLYMDFKERVFKMIKMYTEASNMQHRENEISNMEPDVVEYAKLHEEKFLMELREHMRTGDSLSSTIQDLSPMDMLPEDEDDDYFEYSMRKEDIREMNYMADKLANLLSKQY